MIVLQTKIILLLILSLSSIIKIERPIIVKHNQKEGTEVPSINPHLNVGLQSHYLPDTGSECLCPDSRGAEHRLPLCRCGRRPGASAPIPTHLPRP